MEEDEIGGVNVVQIYETPEGMQELLYEHYDTTQQKCVSLREKLEGHFAVQCKV